MGNGPDREGLYRVVSKRLAGTTLRCPLCHRREEKLSEEAVSRYLTEGWPSCCGQTMTLTASSANP